MDYVQIVRARSFFYGDIRGPSAALKKPLGSAMDGFFVRAEDLPWQGSFAAVIQDACWG